MIAATYTPPNLGTLTAAPTRYHKCGPGGSETFSIEADAVTTVTTPGVVTASVYKDLNVRTETGANTRTDYSVAVNSNIPAELPQKSVVVESSNTAVIADPIDGTAQGVAAGYARLVARATDGEVSAADVSVSIQTGQSVSRWTTAVEGSLNRHLYDQVDSLTAGKDRSSMTLWNKIPQGKGIPLYEWNPACWGAGIDNITCITPYNTKTGQGGGGVLITPRHVLTCHHLGYHPNTLSQVVFVEPDNTQHVYSVTDVLAHPYTAGWVVSLHDILIYKLDRDVPSTIKPAKVLPVDASASLPTIPRYQGDFVLLNGDLARPFTRSCFITKDHLLATGFLETLPNSPYPDVRPGNIVGNEYFFSTVKHWSGQLEESYQGFPSNPLGQQIYIGDSGKPAFVIVNNELVLTNVWTGPRSGYALCTDATIINQMLTDLGGGYQLTTVDLSEFPTY